MMLEEDEAQKIIWGGGLSAYVLVEAEAIADVREELFDRAL
jgi:hypothetical protein